MTSVSWLVKFAPRGSPVFRSVSLRNWVVVTQQICLMWRPTGAQPLRLVLGGSLESPSSSRALLLSVTAPVGALSTQPGLEDGTFGWMLQQLAFLRAGAVFKVASHQRAPKMSHRFLNHPFNVSQVARGRHLSPRRLCSFLFSHKPSYTNDPTLFSETRRRCGRRKILTRSRVISSNSYSISVPLT